MNNERREFEQLVGLLRKMYDRFSPEGQAIMNKTISDHLEAGRPGRQSSQDDRRREATPPGH